MCQRWSLQLRPGALCALLRPELANERQDHFRQIERRIQSITSDYTNFETQTNTRMSVLVEERERTINLYEEAMMAANSSQQERAELADAAREHWWPTELLFPYNMLPTGYQEDMGGRKTSATQIAKMPGLGLCLITV